MSEPRVYTAENARQEIAALKQEKQLLEKIIRRLSERKGTLNASNKRQNNLATTSSKRSRTAASD
jgi:hypothetical protein